MARILQPGGQLLVMDFSMPSWGPFRGVYRLYLHHVLPRLAAAITGNKEAYEYLGSSIEGFPRDQAMLTLIERCGWEKARCQSLCFGIAAIYTAFKKPA